MSKLETSLLFILLAIALAVIVTATFKASRGGPAAEARIELQPESEALDAPEIRVEELRSSREQAEERAVEPVLALARIEGAVIVRGAGGAQELFERMSILVFSSSGKGIQARVERDGTFAAELRLPPVECLEPLTVTLDTEARERIRRTVHLHAVTAPASAGAQYVGSLVFELTDRCVIKGVVIDEARRPLAEVTVALVLLSSQDHAYQVLVEEKTGQDGRFWMEAPLQPELLLAVVERERMPESRFLSTLGGGERDVGEITLSKGEVITGVLLRNDAERAKGDFRISVICPQKRVILLGSGESSYLLNLDGIVLRHYAVFSDVEDGRFRLPGLEPGEYRVDLAFTEGMCQIPGLTDLSLHVDAPADIVLDPQHPQIWIEVRDQREGRPVFADLRIVGAFGEFACHADRKGIGLIFVAPETDYQVFVEAPGYEQAILDLRSPARNGFVEHLVELKPLATGNLVLALDRAWSGRGRLSLRHQGSERTTSHDVDVIDGRIELGALLPGFYEGTLDLWGAGELLRGETDGDLQLTFSAQVRAGEATEQRVPVN